MGKARERQKSPGGRAMMAGGAPRLSRRLRVSVALVPLLVAAAVSCTPTTTTPPGPDECRPPVAYPWRQLYLPGEDDIYLAVAGETPCRGVDPDQIQFQILEAVGSGIAWDSGWIPNSGTSGSVHVPTSLIQPGRAYEWRARSGVSASGDASAWAASTFEVGTTSTTSIPETTTTTTTTPPQRPALMDGFWDNHPKYCCDQPYHWGASEIGRYKNRTNNRGQYFDVRYARRIIGPHDELGAIAHWAGTVIALGYTPVVTPGWGAAYWNDVRGWTDRLMNLDWTGGPTPSGSGVRIWTTLNEPNHVDTETGQGPMTAADLSWSYIVQRDQMWLACKDCLLVVGEFATPLSPTYLYDLRIGIANQLNWIAGVAQLRGWHYPNQWSMHDYSDVAGDTMFAQPDAFPNLEELQSQLGWDAIGASQRGESWPFRIWLTEQGAAVRVAGQWKAVSYSHANQRMAARKFLKLKDHRAAGCGYCAVVDHVFYAAWEAPGAGSDFDSGLVESNGWHRPTYCILEGIDYGNAETNDNC